jgi:hypothetical protein
MSQTSRIYKCFFSNEQDPNIQNVDDVSTSVCIV